MPKGFDIVDNLQVAMINVLECAYFPDVCNKLDQAIKDKKITEPAIIKARNEFIAMLWLSHYIDPNRCDFWKSTWQYFQDIFSAFSLDPKKVEMVINQVLKNVAKKQSAKSGVLRQAIIQKAQKRKKKENEWTRIASEHVQKAKTLAENLYPNLNNAFDLTVVTKPWLTCVVVELFCQLYQSDDPKKMFWLHQYHVAHTEIHFRACQKGDNKDPVHQIKYDKFSQALKSKLDAFRVRDEPFLLTKFICQVSQTLFKQLRNKSTILSTLNTFIGQAKSLPQQYLLYAVGDVLLNGIRTNPMTDKLFGLHHTRSFMVFSERLKEHVIQTTCEQLKNLLPQRAMLRFNTLIKHPLFSEHIPNSVFFGAFGQTKHQKVIQNLAKYASPHRFCFFTHSAVEQVIPHGLIEKNSIVHSGTPLQSEQ